MRESAYRIPLQVPVLGERRDEIRDRLAHEQIDQVDACGLTGFDLGLPPEALGEFVSKVNAVSAEQVRAAGRAYFPSSRQTVVVVGDEAPVKAELAQFGEATVVKP